MTRAGSQRRRADWRNKPVGRLLARIKLPMGSFRFYFNTSVSCEHQAGNLPGGSAGSAGLLSSSSSGIAARLRLLLLLTAVKLGNTDAFFRSVSLPIRLGFKARVSKLPKWVKACLLGEVEKPASETASESDSDSSTSVEWLGCTAPAPWAVLLFGAHLAAPADDSGWLPTDILLLLLLSSSSLPSLSCDLSGEGSLL